MWFCKKANYEKEKNMTKKTTHINLFIFFQKYIFLEVIVMQGTRTWLRRGIFKGAQLAQ